MKIPKLLSNSAIYSVIAFLQKSIMFILLPLYTAYLSKEAYGTLSVVNSITSFLSIFILFSFDSTATRFHYLTESITYVRKLWGTLSIIVIINSLFIGFFVIFLHKWIVDPFTKDITFYPFVFLGVLYVIMTPLYLFFQAYLQAIQNGKYYGINSLSFFVIQVLLTIVFLVFFELSVVGVLLANLLTATIFFIYSLIYFRKKIDWIIDKDILKHAFKYSLPLLPHHLCSWSSGSINSLMLNSYNGAGNTGLYTACNQIGGIVNMIGIAVNKAFSPWFFQNMRGHVANDYQVKEISYNFILLLSIIALGISLFSKEILHVMVSMEYRGIWIYSPFVAFAYVFQGVYFLHVNYLYLSKTTNVFYCTLVSAVANVICNIILLPIMGIMGAVLSTIIAILVRMIMSIFLGKKVTNYIKLNLFRLFLPIVLFLIVSLVIFPLEWVQPWVAFLLKSFLFITTCCISLYINRYFIYGLIKK